MRAGKRPRLPLLESGEAQKPTGADGATGTPLWDMILADAMYQRYQHGLQEYGRRPGDPFKGDPLAEAFEELVDCLNYLNEFRTVAPVREAQEIWGLYLDIERDANRLSLFIRLMHRFGKLSRLQETITSPLLNGSDQDP